MRRLHRVVFALAVGGVAGLATFHGASVAANAQSIPTPQPLAPVPANSSMPLAFAGLTFTAAEASAVAKSPEVAVAQSRVDGASAALAAARATLGPTATAGYLLAPQGGTANNTISQRLTSIGVQTTLGDLLLYSPLVAEAAAKLRAAQADAAVAANTERVKTVGLYFDALKAQAVYDARLGALRLATEQRDAAQTRFNAGAAPRLDIVRADVAVAKAQAAGDLAQALALNATEALRIETDSSQAALTQTVAGTLPSAAGGNLDPATAIARAKARRPELIAAAQNIAAARAATSKARRSIFPAATIGAGYSKGVDGGVSVGGPTINLQLSLPLNGAAHDRVAEQRALYAQSQAQAAATERKIVVAVGDAARSLDAAIRATGASTEARRQALAELRATELGYRNGASSSLEVTSARETYTQAVVDQLTALYDEAKAQATLDIEVGS
ncbi:MAG: TolC family protein [Vulcanimicrobiaceae bacterium]